MAKEVLIVGAGFGGLEAGRELAGRPSVNVTIVDQRNHHLFQPLLYQVATAGLNPADIASPVRAQFSRARNVDVHLGRVEKVDLTEKRATLTEGLSRRATDDLRKLGVEVRTSSAVTDIDANGVEIGGRQKIAAKSVFWAAGVQASGLGGSLGVELDRAGRVKVNADLSIPGHRDAFVI